MIATTTRDFAVTHAAIYQGIPNDTQRAMWLETELTALLVHIDQAIEHGSQDRLLHYAAMLARAYDVPTPALQRAVGGDDE